MSDDSMQAKLDELRPRLTVVGVGGAGCNAINNMMVAGLDGVEFIAANTDAQSLANSSAATKIQLGVTLTEGLGAGARPEIGQAAAEEVIDEITTKVAGSHMVFIAAGLGGGTGTGAAPVIAKAAKDQGILTVAVVTKPFQFEGSRRMRVAEASVDALKANVDTLIVIPNQNLFRITNEKTSFAEAFLLADQVLYSGVSCIVDLIMKDGLINLDFADVRAVMSGMGTAMMGTGEASGENRAFKAAEEAISNPLLDDVSLRGAKGLLLSITGGRDMGLFEVDEAASRVRTEVDAEANVIIGATFDETLEDSVRVSIVASGMPRLAIHGQPPQPGYQMHNTTAGAAVGPAVGQTLPIAGSPQAYGAPDRAASPDETRHDEPDDAEASMRRQEELQRRLSEAMPLSEADIDDATGEQDGGWHGPGDVVIEESGLQLPFDASRPPPAPQSDEPDPGVQPVDSFQPAPPEPIRRAPQRMPSLEEFPVVGQREFRAKVGEPPANDQEPGDKPKRESLFRRLTGFARRSGDSREGGSKPAGSVTDRPDIAGHASHPHASEAARGDAEEEGSNHQENIDFPAFVSRDRRSS